jgi:ATP-dependent Lhr-like helicase
MEIKKRRKGIQYYFENLSTIHDVKSFKVINVIDNSFVGNLDEEFVVLNCEEGKTFIVKGEPWKILSIEKDKVLVEPTEDIEAIIPAWEGELIPVPFEVAQEVGKLRRKIAELILERNEGEIISWLQANYPIDENCAKKMVKIVEKQLKYGIVPDDETLLVEDFENAIIIHACFGSLVNETLGRLIVTLLTARIGSVGLRTDPYRIIIKPQAKVLELVKEILFKTNPAHLKEYLELSLIRTSLFEWKFLQVAKRFGIIAKDAEYGKISLRRIIDEYINTPVYRETLNEIEFEKLDIEKTKEILEKIQSGKIKVVLKSGLSPLGKIGLQHWVELVKPAKPEKEIFEIFKNRLFSTKVRLVCMNCGNWSQTFVLKEMPEDVECKKCGARLLGITKATGEKILKIIKRKIRKLPLTQEESKIYKRISRTADLFLCYRKKAAIALAGKGIGPTTALRILSRYHASEEEFLKDIFRAEKSYQMTKRYWKI